MRWSIFLLAATLIADVTASAVAAPPRTEKEVLGPLEQTERDAPAYEELWKRKGGGGGGGRGGGGGGRGGGGGGRGGGGGGRGGGGRSGSGSSSGSRTGTGAPRTFGGGRYYGGGASTPYPAGNKSPRAGIAPVFFVGAALAFWPGLWLYGAYLYHYPHPYHFYNHSSNQNETKEVQCACSQAGECGCDIPSGDPRNLTYLDELIGNGSYNALNHSLITVANVNGTDTILINGTLPPGTTAPSDAGTGLAMLLRNAGWWPVVAAVCAIVFTT
ncbi:hypothetical protein VTK26DRAFT_7522 [Humicola hyalothermophila]